MCQFYYLELLFTNAFCKEKNIIVNLYLAHCVFNE